MTLYIYMALQSLLAENIIGDAETGVVNYFGFYGPEDIRK